jgi:16S rRNA (guanine527-N7)-methyltransferase
VNVSPDPAAGPTPPPELAAAARRLFGPALPVATAYADLLATDGVVRGLIGPREAPRIWDRHLLNCAVVSELIPTDASVVDVGAGAGLPGIVLAIARPDLAVLLVEPMARRIAFLLEVVAVLGLASRVSVLRARAEELPGGAVTPADVVTARAVAPLDRLAGWCLPLVARGGRLLALKGASAAEEVIAHHDAIRRLGGATPVVRRCGVGLVEPPTTVVEIVREREVPTARPSRASGAARPSGKSTSDGRAGRGGSRSR